MTWCERFGFVVPILLCPCHLHYNHRHEISSLQDLKLNTKFSTPNAQDIFQNTLSEHVQSNHIHTQH